MNSTPSPSYSPLTTRRILKTWWPLALSWFLLTAEQPILAGLVARSAEPKVQLAAWGLAFPLILILSAPSISMLSASTTLSKDWDSFRRGQKYMLWLVGGLTFVHFLLAFTPLFDFVVNRAIAPPPELIEPARMGVRILLPFVPSLAIRRFQYGVLIRFDHTRAVTLGSLVRLLLEAALGIGLLLFSDWSGIVIATTTISAGVIFEAVYAVWRVRPVLRDELKPAPAVATPLTLNRFTRFYVPLMLTTLLQILIQPIVTASLSRMPQPLESLAMWPVLYGVLIMINSASIAYVEAVVVLLDRRGSVEALGRFTWQLGLFVAAVPVLLAVTPFGPFWFLRVAALPPELLPQAQFALWLMIPLPALTVVASWFQGTLLNSHRTRGITEGASLSLTTVTILLTLGSLWGGMSGVYVAMLAFTIGSCIRNLWLWRRSQTAFWSIRLRQARA